ncbi:MAG: CBS domain-containing protein [Microthrixaceae bacterium]
MKIIEAVRRNAVTVEPDTSIEATAQLMERSGVGALPVVDGGELVGIVTDRDIVCRGIAANVANDARIDSLMSTPVHSVAVDADLQAAFATFREHPVRRLVVTDGEGVVGMITVDDLLINVSADLADLSRPVTGETIFGHRDAPVPRTADG